VTSQPWESGQVVTSPAFADVAQLVERNLAKVEVAGSNPVVRSVERAVTRPPLSFGDVAEWLGKGLQNPVPGFDSRRRLRRYNVAYGRLAQWESASLTRKRSAVQSCQRPRRISIGGSSCALERSAVPLRSGRSDATEAWWAGRTDPIEAVCMTRPRRCACASGNRPVRSWRRT
jgi:hypothetical protein